MEAVLMTLVASVLTGAVSAVATVKALGVHIHYLREGLRRVESDTQRAHRRIDSLVGGECEN